MISRRTFLKLVALGTASSLASYLSLKTAGLLRGAPNVGAYYYPWYDRAAWRYKDKNIPPESWLKLKPLLGWYDSRDPQVIQTHFRWAKEADIDFFILSFWDIAKGDLNFQSCESIFNMAESERVKPNLCMMIEVYGKSEKRVQKMVDFLWDDWAQREYYQRYKGGPLLLIYNPKHLDLNNPGFTLRYVGISPLKGSAWNYWTRLEHSLFLWSGEQFSVLPGYDDCSLYLLGEKEKPTLYNSPRNPLLYKLYWMLASYLNAEIVLITSWNEYLEHTSIEPSVGFGEGLDAHYFLRATKNYKMGNFFFK
jgi:hypothetical protein